MCRNMLQHVSSSANGGRPVLGTRNLSDLPRERALLSPRLGGLAHARERTGALSLDLSGVSSPSAGGPATPLPRVPHCGRLCAAPEIASCRVSPRRRTRQTSALSSVGTTRAWRVFRPSPQTVSPAPLPSHGGICVGPCAVHRSEPAEFSVYAEAETWRGARAPRGPEAAPGPST